MIFHILSVDHVVCSLQDAAFSVRYMLIAWQEQ